MTICLLFAFNKWRGGAFNNVSIEFNIFTGIWPALLCSIKWIFIKSCAIFSCSQWAIYKTDTNKIVMSHCPTLTFIPCNSFTLFQNFDLFVFLTTVMHLSPPVNILNVHHRQILAKYRPHS